MKPTKTLLMMGLVSAASCCFWSCDDDDWGKVDGGDPVVSLTTDHVKSAIGRTFTLNGLLEDNDGIKTVKLYCPELFLNKTIDVIDIYGEPQKKYNLNYSFPIAKDEKGDNFKIQVTVTDVCGKQTTKTVSVTMDGDFENPTFTTAPGEEVTLIMKSRTTYQLNVNVSDDQGLAFLSVDIRTLKGEDGQPYSKMISCDGVKKYSFSDKILFPNEETSYLLELRVIDKEGKITEKQSVITVSSKVPDYPNLWLADVESADELNRDIFGVPMYVDHAIDAAGDSIPFTYVARYYNEKAGTKVKFLGQKNDFSPVCYGVDKADANLLSDDEEAMQGLVLNEAGVYYKITFNIKNYSIQTETYPVSQALAAFRTDLYGQDKLDTWCDGGGWWSKFTLGYLSGGPGDVISFVQDSKNPNLFYLQDPLTFDASNNLKEDGGNYCTNFIIHNFHPGGWWDMVCYKPNSKEDPEFWPWWGNDSQPQLMTEGWTEWAGYHDVRLKGDNWCKAPVSPSQFGDYRLYFDAHLQRAKLVPAK